MRFGEATRRATGTAEHRVLDRAAYVILRHLADAGPQNVSALAARLNLDGSTVTRQVSALQRDSLITRTPDPSDGRAPSSPHRRRPPTDGRRAGRPHPALRRHAGRLSTEDRATLATLLSRLNQALINRNRPADPPTPALHPPTLLPPTLLPSQPRAPPRPPSPASPHPAQPHPTSPSLTPPAPASPHQPQPPPPPPRPQLVDLGLMVGIRAVSRHIPGTTSPRSARGTSQLRRSCTYRWKKQGQIGTERGP
ncbi:MarR family transcriptional regulator [Micromonospora sp. M12]